MIYKSKDEIKKIVTTCKEYLKDGITFADVMPVITHIVNLTMQLVTQYADPLVLHRKIGDILYRSDDLSNSDNVVVSLCKLSRGDKEFICDINSLTFRAKLLEGQVKTDVSTFNKSEFMPSQVDADIIKANYVLSVQLLVKTHLESVLDRSRKEMHKQWRKESPHLFKAYDARMKMYRERYNELMKKKQDDEAKQSRVEAKDEKEPESNKLSM